MRWSLLSLILLAGCATGRSRAYDEQVAARAGEAETAVTQARQARDAALRFLEVATAEDEAAHSQLRAQAQERTLVLRALASQAKREYARALVLLRDAELQVAKDQARRVREDSPRLQEKLARDLAKVADRTTWTEHQRMMWDSQRRAADYAMLSPPYAAPARPVAPLAGGANEGPSGGFQEVPAQPEMR